MLNGYYRCVFEYSKGFMTLDKVYKFEDGKFTQEDGTRGFHYLSAEEFNNRNHTKIKEIKNNKK